MPIEYLLEKPFKDFEQFEDVIERSIRDGKVTQQELFDHAKSIAPNIGCNNISNSDYAIYEYICYKDEDGDEVRRIGEESYKGAKSSCPVRQKLKKNHEL